MCCRPTCVFLPLALLLASAPAVATCRQTVEALLAPHHRLAADGYDLATDDSRSPTVATCPRSHLSPDGGGVTRTPPPLGSGWLRFGNKIWCQAHDEHSALLLASVPGRSHLSPDGGGVTRAAPPLGSGWLRFGNKIWCQAHDERSALLLASVHGATGCLPTTSMVMAV